MFHNQFGALMQSGLLADLEKTPHRLREFADLYRGRIAELPAADLADACRRCEQVLEPVQRATALADAMLAADASDPDAGALLDRCDRLWSLIAADAEFFDRELASTTPGRLTELLGEPQLAPFANHLRKIQAAASLVPPAQVAAVLARVDSVAGWEALARQLLDRIRPYAGGRPTALGEVLPGLYGGQREARQAARDAVSTALRPEVDLRASVLVAVSAARWNADRVRGARSRLDVALHADQVRPGDVADLLAAVRESAGIVHGYYAAKAEFLGTALDDADRYAPLADVPEQRLEPAEATELVLDAFGAVSPLLRRIARQLLDDGTVDLAPRPGKRAGAATYVVPGGPSFVVLNFHGRLRDVLLLGHELGHAVHARLCAGRGLFEQAIPPVLAETVGLFFEAVVADRCVRRAGDPVRVRLALARWLEDQMVATFRAAALHELESAVYAAVDAGDHPDADWIADRWTAGQRSLYGDAVRLSAGYRHWWSYLDDLYFAPGTRYAYPYGQLAARAMLARHRDAPAAFAADLERLLRSGASAPPHELLPAVGVELAGGRAWTAGLSDLAAEVGDLIAAGPPRRPPKTSAAGSGRPAAGPPPDRCRQEVTSRDHHHARAQDQHGVGRQRGLTHPARWWAAVPPLPTSGPTRPRLLVTRRPPRPRQSRRSRHVSDSVLPVMKHMNPVFEFGDTLYVGGFGEVTEIPDPDGAIRRLVSLADGSRTVEEIHRDLARDHPGVSLADVRAAIEQLDEAGFLLNGAATADGLLDDYELGRWERNVNFFGSYTRLDGNKYAQQRKLLDCRVTLLGLGGLGSHILLDLAAMGIGHVRVVEFDRVELSNLNRQILYRDADVGKAKIDLAVARVQEFNPHIDIEKSPGRIRCTDDVLTAITGADVLISVADRPKMEINHWVNEACVRFGVPLVTGGLDTQRAVYFTVIPGTTGCIECWRLGVFRSDDVSAALLHERRERQIGGDNAAFVPLVTMTTGLLIGEMVRLVTGIAPPVAAGRLMQLRFDDYSMTEYERWDRLPDCPVCGNPAPSGRETPLAEPSGRA